MQKTSIIIFVLLFLFSIGVFSQENYQFSFGERYSDESILINDAVHYNNSMGYGFDYNNKELVRLVNAPVGYCTADQPFYFSVLLHEDTYQVEITFGHPTLNSETTVKAEARRLMLFNETVSKGKTKTVVFTVNVRSPKIDEEQSIKIKPREANYMNWDNRLTLEFSGENVAVRHIKITPTYNFTTVYLAGNSTVTDQDCAPWASWGQMITNYFDNHVVVANYAESGESLQSFKNAGRLDKILSLIQPGDYLFIEFGHNDQKQKGEGIGPWESYTNLLIEYIELARNKGAIPVLITPTQRRSFNSEGFIDYTHEDYPAAMRKVASDHNVPLIDLNEMTKVLYETWGPEESKNAFVHYPANTFPGQDKALADNTHFNTFGAHEIALLIIQGIIDIELDISKHIINFNPPYSPEQPNSFNDWDLIMSPRFISEKPDGN